MKQLSLQILVLFLVSGLVTIPAYAISEKGPRCSNGLDDDDDGLFDGDDPDCKPDLVGSWEQVINNVCFQETYKGTVTYGSDGTVQAGGTISVQGAWEEGSGNTYYQTTWAYYPADHPNCPNCTVKVNQQITLDPGGNAFTASSQTDLWLDGGYKISEVVCLPVTGNPWIDTETTATRITVEIPAP